MIAAPRSPQNSFAQRQFARLLPPSRRSQRWRSPLSVVLASVVTVLGCWGSPAFAGDPFRTSNPSTSIDDQTEAAFRAMFEQGDYRQAAELLNEADTTEPLAYALKASIAYVNEDWDAMGENARLTREMAEQLLEADPLRGNLYVAAGMFLEGAYTLSTEGTLQATPTILGKLQQVFGHLSEAEKINPNDPELNLLKGYMDLMLAVNLPFTDPAQAIARLESYASPSYLAQRGIAIGYRDLDQPAEALTAVDQALTETPDNPELFYLKAQILRLLSDDAETDQNQLRQQSLDYFRQAWALRDRLPDSTVSQLEREACRTYQQSRNKNADDCSRQAINWQQPQRNQQGNRQNNRPANEPQAAESTAVPAN